MNPATLAKGDVVLAPFPYTDLSTNKLRPALVLAVVVRDDLMVAYITSVPRVLAGDVVVALSSDDPEFAQTGLGVPSTVRLSRIVTINRRIVTRRLGAIGPRTVQRVDAALRQILGI